MFDTLSKVEQYVPGYNKNDGYILSGFVWFQGWQDHMDWNKINQYKTNLINLIRDIRLDLYSPNLPFIIGELGTTPVPNWDDDKVLPFRKIQEEVANMDEFRDRARFVKTSPYVIANEEKYDAVYHYWGRADTFCNIGKAFGRAMLGLLEKSKESVIRDFAWHPWLDDKHNQGTTSVNR